MTMAAMNKAAFKALREDIGISQAALAKELGVTVRSVSRWENPREDNEPQQFAIDYLQDMADTNNQVVEFAISKAYELRETTGINKVSLSYHYDQASYDKYHVPEDEGYYGIANANTLKVKRSLEEDGFEVQINYPG